MSESNVRALFIGGFTNNKETCLQFSSELSEVTGWDITTQTFQDVVKKPSLVSRYKNLDIIITHSAAIFLLDNLQRKPKLVVAHSPPSNIQRREFLYRYLSRQVKHLLNLTNPFGSNKTINITQMPKLLNQITECDLEQLLDKFDNWLVLSPKNSALFSENDYPDTLKNNENFVRVGDKKYNLFTNAEATIQQICKTFKAIK